MEMARSDTSQIQLNIELLETEEERAEPVLRFNVFLSSILFFR